MPPSPEKTTSSMNSSASRCMSKPSSGLKLGKRLFDDGHSMAEKNIISLGDDVTLNAGSYIQVHTQEDYAFKCEGTTVGSGVTFGVGVGTTVGSAVGIGVGLGVAVGVGVGFGGSVTVTDAAGPA